MIPFYVHWGGLIVPSFMHPCFKDMHGFEMASFFYKPGLAQSGHSSLSDLCPGAVGKSEILNSGWCSLCSGEWGFGCYLVCMFWAYLSSPPNVVISIVGVILSPIGLCVYSLTQVFCSDSYTQLIGG